MSNQTIGRFRLVRRVGAGGMGVVYEAIDERDDTRVALKVLLPHAAEEAEGLLRFKREFRALARLRHPNIVRVLDAGLENDVPFLAMEFVDGKDARRHLRTLPEGAAREAELKRLLRQLFGALAHIHARRIVHRDLKPENILISTDGRVKLMDFGVARLLRAPTGSSGLLGTFAYMAPEQVTGGEIDGRSDLYAVGVFLYEILTGEYPFPVEPPAAALHHHVNTKPEHVQKTNPKVDPGLAALTHKLLEKDPLDRLQTAEEAYQYLADEELPGPTGSSPDALPALPGQLFAPRFVGRGQELAILEDAVADAERGRGRILVIEGPSGTGKSRLLAELRARVRRRANVLIGQCAAERSQAYGPIQVILDEIEGIAARTPPEVVRKIVGRDAALVQAVSPRLARLGGPASVEHLDASERRVRLHKAIVGVVGRLALVRPVVLAVEDVHWADSASIELLWDASRTLLAPRPGGKDGETVCPVVIVLTRRSLAEGPDASEQLVRRLEERKLVAHLSLGALEPAQVLEMVRTMTGVQRPLPGMVGEVVRLARGRPLLVQEVLESWLSDGALLRQTGIWSFRGDTLETHADGVAAPAPDLGMAPSEDITTNRSQSPRSRRPRPSRAEDVALQKLDRLSGAAKGLLERLALLGRLLPAELVQAVQVLEEEEFLDAMDEVVRANLLVEDVSHDGVRYRFYHEGFRDAVARALPEVRRTELHAQIGRRLERRFANRRVELAHVLARHFRASGHPERAIRYLLFQATAAAARGDLEAALRRLQDAETIIDDAPRTLASRTRRLRVLIQRIDLLLDFGRAKEALDRADPAAAESARSPEVMTAELILRRAACQFALGRLDETLATLAGLERRTATRSLAARALELEGRARMSRGEHALALQALEEARQIAAAAGLNALAEELDARVGIALLHQGAYAAALLKLESGLGHARARRDAHATAELLGHIGIVHAARGHSTDALACYREAIEIAEARGVLADLERWSGELGTLLTELGDFEGARQKLTAALQMAEERGNRQGEATWRGELGVHYLKAGRPERAQPELLRCLAIAREIGFQRYVAIAHLYLGLLALEEKLDDLELAREHLDEGLELARELGQEELVVIGMVHRARLLVADGDPKAARVLMDRAKELADRLENLRVRAKLTEA
ncbi:MAG: protein kinase [Deltaproteobacteria bacterium]|nr:protein kinase [Deltaproteobacteria bacterium]